MPSLSEVFRTVPVKLKVEPDINSMKEVPELYVWPHEDQVGVEDEKSHGMGLPVIDLKEDLGSLLESLKGACEECGAFQIVNHGVSQELVEKVKKQGHRFFSLPLDRKMMAQRTPDGVTGYGMARICKFFSKLMWSEGFTCIGSPLDHARKLWPNDYQEFCEAIEEYEHSMEKLATELMRLILQSLGVKPTNYIWWREDGRGGESFAGALQMNHYPSCPCPSQTMGMAAHTDSSFLTVLYQGNVEGLQFKRQDGSWELVPALPNAFVVNLGDLLEVLSNGRYKSVVHRAVNNSKARSSYAYLWGPPLNAVIEPAGELVDSKHPRLYKSLTWHEYLVVRANHFSKALQLFAYVQ